MADAPKSFDSILVLGVPSALRTTMEPEYKSKGATFVSPGFLINEGHLGVDDCDLILVYGSLTGAETTALNRLTPPNVPVYNRNTPSVLEEFLRHNLTACVSGSPPPPPAPVPDVPSPPDDPVPDPADSDLDTDVSTVKVWTDFIVLGRPGTLAGAIQKAFNPKDLVAAESFEAHEAQILGILRGSGFANPNPDTVRAYVGQCRSAYYRTLNPEEAEEITRRLRKRNYAKTPQPTPPAPPPPPPGPLGPATGDTVFGSDSPEQTASPFRVVDKPRQEGSDSLSGPLDMAELYKSLTSGQKWELFLLLNRELASNPFSGTSNSKMTA